MQKGKSVGFYNFFLFKCKMLIIDIVKTCSYLVARKWKAFYIQTRIPGPIFITNLILSSAPTNISALHYGLILIQQGSRVIATSTMVTATSSMVIEPKSVVLFRLQVHS